MYVHPSHLQAVYLPFYIFVFHSSSLSLFLSISLSLFLVLFFFLFSHISPHTNMFSSPPPQTHTHTHTYSHRPHTNTFSSYHPTPHTASPTSQDQTKIFPAREEGSYSRITCVALTDDFLYYGTEAGTVEVFFLGEYVLLAGIVRFFFQ